jgi:tRNA (Thr-GGU) A37 N-methylase
MNKKHAACWHNKEIVFRPIGVIHSDHHKPFLDGEKDRGIFAIRHFNRPNPLGLSIVKLLKVQGNILEVEGMDILDGTPLIDIKPYVQKFDHRDDVKSGWVDNQHLDDIAAWNSTPKELRNRNRTNL